ncbi:MAG: leucyl aminopeptidase [Agarilytica sp.]
MDFVVKKCEISKHKTQCAVVFALHNTLLASADTADKALNGELTAAIKNKDLDSNAGSTLIFNSAKADASFERVLLVQLGKPSKSRSTQILTKTWRSACNAIFVAAKSRPIKDLCVYTDDISLDAEPNSNALLSTTLSKAGEYATYAYDTTKSSTKNDVKRASLKKTTIVTPTSASNKHAVTQGKAIASGINTARELGNLPGNICTPKYLANFAKTLATKHQKLSVKALGEKQMEKLGMGAFLSVSKGSDEEGKLIIMEYRNGPAKAKPHVLVGKGITFDTGGISLKPGPTMDEMKFDMCGAASVFGAMTALLEMKAPVNVVAIIAAAENMPSGGASKPGDVVTTMSGMTIEILNTDAEGRLVLCDALSYAERFKPKSVVDVATLTGACVIALGSHATGLYSNNEKLAQSLLDAGERTGDRAWQMPLWDEYKKQLDSNFADMANIGGREAGSVTAACFLSRFTEQYPWAHLDIAGTAWHSGARKGATGRPVSLLVDYLLNN